MKHQKIVVLIRDIFEYDRTLGCLYLDGDHFCYTLEDAVRGDGIKIYAKTALPAGVYPLGICYSNKFQRHMVEILNVPNFTDLRVHGLNRPKETKGCVGVAYEKSKDEKQRSIIYKTAESKFFDYVQKEIDAGNEVWLVIQKKV